MIDYCVVQKVCNGRQWIHTTFTNLRKAVSDTAFPKFIELAILLIVYLFRNTVLVCAFKLYPLTLCWPVLFLYHNITSAYYIFGCHDVVMRLGNCSAHPLILLYHRGAPKERSHIRYDMYPPFLASMSAMSVFY